MVMVRGVGLFFAGEPGAPLLVIQPVIAVGLGMEALIWIGLTLVAAVMLWFGSRMAGRESKRLESLSSEELKDDGWPIR